MNNAAFIVIDPKETSYTGSPATWLDYDASSVVPEEASGLLLHIRHNRSSTGTSINIKNKGSTLAITINLSTSERFYTAVGLDVNKKFQFNYTNIYSSKWYIKILGYFHNDHVVFFDQIKQPSVSSGFFDINMSSYTGTDKATAAIVNSTSASYTTTNIYFRNNGSTDDRTPSRLANSPVFQIVGVDKNEIFEANANISNNRIQGYFKSGITMFTNGVQVTTVDGVGVWNKLHHEQGNIGGLVVEAVVTSNVALRPSDKTDLPADYNSGSSVVGLLMSSDKDGNIDEQHSNAGQSYYVMGYLDYFPPSTGKLINPTSEIIREPGLLIPGKKPVGNVVIDWSNTITDGLLAYYFSNSLYLRNIYSDLTGKHPATYIHPGVNYINKSPTGFDVLNQVTFAVPNFNPDEYIDISDAPFDALEQISISAWVHCDDTKSRTIVSKAEAGGFGLELDGGRKFQFVIHTSGSYKVAEWSGTVLTSAAYHVVGTYDGANVKIYINGELKATTACTGTITSTTGYKMSLGSNPGSSRSNFFDGQIDNIMIWKRGILSSQVNSIFNNVYQFLIPA